MRLEGTPLAYDESCDLKFEASQTLVVQGGNRQIESPS